MSEIKFTDLDFAKIKENLKQYLKSQNKFADYDFDGSGMSVLLDVLAYNTAYNGFYLNMVASEMFLDSAAQRESVVSRAKHLGYTPSSRRGLSAVIDIVFDFNGAAMPDPVTGVLIKRTDNLRCTIDTVRYLFSPRQQVFAEPIGNKKYIARNVQLVEGRRLITRWVYDETTPIKQRFIIPNPNIDLTTLVVTVKQSATSTTITPFKQFQDINTLTGEDNIYYLEESPGEQYEIVFGDGVLGRRLVNGNIIEVEYVVPTNDAAAGVTSFLPESTTLGWAGTAPIPTRSGNKNVHTIICKVAAKDYAEKESIDQIKFMAPKLYDAQSRAVTKNDYEILLKKDIAVIDPKIQYLRVWGGEENDPPEYGKVFCAVKPYAGLKLNTAEKQRMIEQYIRPKNMVSVQVEIVEPEYIGLVVDTTVNYFSNKTTYTGDVIKSLVFDKIKTYRDKNILGFDSDLRYSKFIKAIDDADPSIESNITHIKLKYRITPALSVPFYTTIPLSNTLDTGDVLNSSRSITSTPFYFTSVLVYIGDDGLGNLGIYPANSTASTAPIVKVGIVDYLSGVIKIEGLIVDEIPNLQNNIIIYAKPKTNDILAYKNQILLLDDSDIQVSVVNLNSVKLS